MTDMTRRSLLRGAGAAVLALGASSLASPVRAAASKRKRLIRLAHLTDMHVEPELHSAEGFARALEHVQSQRDRPELILFGGDHVMDSMDADDDRTETQWRLFKSVLKSECSLPHESCIGNHDVWGWGKARAHTTGSEPNFGKQRALDELGLSGRYRSFDRAGWHFVILDSIYPRDQDFRSLIDEEQFAWLESDLAANTHVPALVMSHVPLFTITTLINNKLKDDNTYHVSGVAMHGDSGRFRNLFKRYPNVRVALSGHTHLIDRVDYNQVTYLCGGAVSGMWWRGPNGNGDCPEGYSLIDLYDDGSVEREYTAYGWTAQA